MDAAVQAARRAFPTWAALPRAERAALLRKVADGIDVRAEDLARVETRTTAPCCAPTDAA